MKRYLILNGDETTANGTVQATSSTVQMNGQDVAHEGDGVACPSCNTTGKIQCDGPRQMMTAPDRRHAAISEDLCIAVGSVFTRLGFVADTRSRTRYRPDAARPQDQLDSKDHH